MAAFVEERVDKREESAPDSQLELRGPVGKIEILFCTDLRVLASTAYVSREELNTRSVVPFSPLSDHYYPPPDSKEIAIFPECRDGRDSRSRIMHMHTQSASRRSLEAIRVKAPCPIGLGTLGVPFGLQKLHC